MAPPCKIPNENYTEALRLYAEGESIAVIYRGLQEKNISLPTLPAFYNIFKAKKNQELIQRLRGDYYKRVLDEPIAHKRTRISALQETFLQIKNTLKTFIGEGGAIKPKMLKKYAPLVRQLNAVLETAKNEMEKQIPLQIYNIDSVELTVEEMRNELADIDEKLIGFRNRGISLSIDEEEKPQEPTGRQTPEQPS